MSVREELLDMIANPPCKQCDWWDAQGHFCYHSPLDDDEPCVLVSGILSHPRIAILAENQNGPMRIKDWRRIEVKE